ncbi:MAG: YggU family protein [Archaeoglobus sp.]|jgi:uncharacterized protein (TIGR00251 family)|nr:MAG: YggU family protein [Archaeoglobus sp.]
MSLEKAVKETKNGCYLTIEVSPNSKRRELRGYNKWRQSIEVAVKAQPKGGKANSEVEKFLSELFNTRVSIVRGKTSHQKVVFVHLSKKDVIKKLEELIQ